MQIVILTILLVTGIEKVLIEYIFVTKNGEDIMNAYEVLMSILLVIRICASLSVLFLFIQSLIFIINSKKQKLKSSSLSTLNRCVITLVSPLMMDRFGHYILINGYSVGIVIDPQEMRDLPSFNLVWTWFRQCTGPIRDSLELALICYMLYH